MLVPVSTHLDEAAAVGAEEGDGVRRGGGDGQAGDAHVGQLQRRTALQRGHARDLQTHLAKVRNVAARALKPNSDRSDVQECVVAGKGIDFAAFKKCNM